MPNLNEFFNKPEIMHEAGLEKIDGIKSCGKCDKDAQEAFWNPSTLILTWECPDGHHNQFKVN
jgi:hypothetical protein